MHTHGRTCVCMRVCMHMCMCACVRERIHEFGSHAFACTRACLHYTVHVQCMSYFGGIE